MQQCPLHPHLFLGRQRPLFPIHMMVNPYLHLQPQLSFPLLPMLVYLDTLMSMQQYPLCPHRLLATLPTIPTPHGHASLSTSAASTQLTSAAHAGVPGRVTVRIVSVHTPRMSASLPDQASAFVPGVSQSAPMFPSSGCVTSRTDFSHTTPSGHGSISHSNSESSLPSQVAAVAQPTNPSIHNLIRNRQSLISSLPDGWCDQTENHDQIRLCKLSNIPPQLLHILNCLIVETDLSWKVFVHAWS